MSLNDIFGSSVAKILDVLYEYQEIGITLSDIASEAHVNKSTLNEKIALLEPLGIVVLSRQVGNAKLYTLNKDDEVVKSLVVFMDKLNLRSAEIEAGRQGSSEETNVKSDMVI